MRSARAGFTLIELMVVVAILGVLAAVAIPSFNIYVRRTKSAEAPATLKLLYDGAASYYQKEVAESGLTGIHRVHCVVPSAHNNLDPGDRKQPGEYAAAEWKAIAFWMGYSYYRYELVSAAAASTCGAPPNDPSVYTMRAIGDLDGDDDNSTFDLAVGSNDNNELYHARGFHLRHEYE